MLCFLETHVYRSTMLKFSILLNYKYQSKAGGSRVSEFDIRLIMLVYLLMKSLLILLIMDSYCLLSFSDIIAI